MFQSILKDRFEKFIIFIQLSLFEQLQKLTTDFLFQQKKKKSNPECWFILNGTSIAKILESVKVLYQ